MVVAVVSVRMQVRQQRRLWCSSGRRLLQHRGHAVRYGGRSRQPPTLTAARTDATAVAAVIKRASGGSGAAAATAVADRIWQPRGLWMSAFSLVWWRPGQTVVSAADIFYNNLLLDDTRKRSAAAFVTRHACVDVKCARAFTAGRRRPYLIRSDPSRRRRRRDAR